MTWKRHQVVDALLVVSLRVLVDDSSIGPRLEAVLFEVRDEVRLLLGTQNGISIYLLDAGLLVHQRLHEVLVSRPLLRLSRRLLALPYLGQVLQLKSIAIAWLHVA